MRLRRQCATPRDLVTCHVIAIGSPLGRELRRAYGSNCSWYVVVGMGYGGRWLKKTSMRKNLTSGIDEKKNLRNLSGIGGGKSEHQSIKNFLTQWELWRKIERLLMRSCSSPRGVRWGWAECVGKNSPNEEGTEEENHKIYQWNGLSNLWKNSGNRINHTLIQPTSTRELKTHGMLAFTETRFSIWLNYQNFIWSYAKWNLMIKKTPPRFLPYPIHGKLGWLPYALFFLLITQRLGYPLILDDAPFRVLRQSRILFELM